MTLNLALLVPGHDYVMQVSDRLLTERTSGRQFDALTNKNVIFRARDGLVSICYAGPAYLEHIPTDTWIACKLADEDIGEYLGGEKVGMRMRSAPKSSWLDIGQSVDVLRRELRGLNLVDRLDVMVAGWQECKRGMRPICWAIEARGMTATAESPLHRHWHYEMSSDGERCYYLAEIPGDPGGWLSPSQLEFLIWLLRLAVSSQEAAVRRLIWAVRCVAGRTSRVGADCMCILLPDPNKQPELFVRYEPVTEGRAVITGGKRSVEVPAAHTPWYVGPKIHAPPRTIGGGGVGLMLNHIRVIELTPPMPRGTGFLSFSATQPRPPDPSLGPN